MLIPSSAIRSEFCYFDRFFNSGGEDTDFCFRMRSANFKIRFSSLAVLHEHENHVKNSDAYIRERTIRDAVNYSLIVKRNSNFYLICTRIMKISFRIIQSSLFYIFDKKNATNFLSNRAALIAILTGKGF